jgi:putative ABC transport system permease protein
MSYICGCSALLIKPGISPWVFALSEGMMILIALLTISYQTIKAALANPVKSLRNE